jgi:hypothetical protein
MTRTSRFQLVSLLLLGAIAAPLSAQQPEPYVVEYYYKAQWGHAQEFIDLFRKNHFPVLQHDVQNGRILEVTAMAPRYHATEDGRWDYRVTIVFRDVAAAFSPGPSDEEMRRLYPDQETFQREEQRRFQILEAHWDVPIQPVILASDGR